MVTCSFGVAKGPPDDEGRQLDGGGKDEGGGAQQMSVRTFFDCLAPHRGNKKKKNNYASAVPAWVAHVAGAVQVE